MWVTDRRGLALAAALTLTGCEPVPEALEVHGGDPDQGRRLLAGYGCSACHRIPGVALPDGPVGPDLTGFGRRAYIAGRLPNRPALLTQWIRHPTQVDPETAMPDMGVSHQEALHMAAYLYTLR